MVSIMDYGSAPQQQPNQQQQIMSQQQQQQMRPDDVKPPKSAVSQRSVELQLSPKTNSTELAKRALKLDLVSATTKELEEFGIKSPRSPLANSGYISNATRGLQTWKKISSIDAVNGKNELAKLIRLQLFLPPKQRQGSVRSGRLPHQTSLTAQVDLVEDRKTLRDALYQGIFHRHRRTIFAVGSFLRMLRSRNSQYNTIRSSSEGEDIDDAR